MADSQGGGGRSRGRLIAFAVAIVVGSLVVVDVGLRLLGLVAPDDPLLFFTRTHAAAIDPFVEVADGTLEIRPDWVNDGLGLRGRRGIRAGRQFLLPGFRPTRLAREKPVGTIRVVALGGSTTYGLYVGKEAAFPAVLGARIAERLGRDVEVVNLGCPGFASDRVLALLPAALGLAPDVVVVLSGHNEMLSGDVGPTSGLSPGLRLRAGLLRLSTLFGWWNHLVAGALRDAQAQPLREEVAAVEAGEIPTFVPEAVPASQRRLPSDAFRAAAASRYAANVRGMIARARDARVPILFVVPVANPRSPPGWSGHAEGVAASGPFRAALRAARALREAGKLEAALDRVDEALSLSPGYADAHFERGEILQALGRESDARGAYARAIDADGRTHRITSPLQAALLGVLQEEGAASVDPRATLPGRLEDAETLFTDHLHPTPQGHALLVELLIPRVLEQIAPGRPGA